MSEIIDVKNDTLPIIEVPPELRGLSDEEIIKRSEKELREVSGKRKKGERRPSKRDRLAMKAQRASDEARTLFGIAAESQRDMIKNAFTEKSRSFSTFDPQKASFGATGFLTAAAIPSRNPSDERNISVPEPTTPSSGRVLKASFGAKIGEKPKAIIISAAELALQKAEERAKKIREALFAKRSASPANSASTASAPAAVTADTPPVKRPRGRPRKNPLPAND